MILYDKLPFLLVSLFSLHYRRLCGCRNSPRRHGVHELLSFNVEDGGDGHAGELQTEDV